jgi:Flp pilus assembly protein TadD
MNERAILAAQGYLELGMATEALAELQSLPPEAGNDPDIEELRLHVLMQAKRWEEAVASSRHLLKLRSDSPSAHIQGAFALHELGRTCEARDFLMSGPETLREDPTYHYNVGCYEAVLGNPDAAMTSLRKSFALDESYRDFALRDPDLRLLHPELESAS